MPIYLTCINTRHTQPSASYMQISTSPSSIMSPSTPLPSPHLLRKSPPNSRLDSGSPRTSPTMESFDANVIAIIAALVCTVTIGLILHAIIRFTFQVLKQRLYPNDPEAGRGLSNQVYQFGVKRKALRALPTLAYSDKLSSDSECMICLSEFQRGEKIRVLTKCRHEFHQKCIDQWLKEHSSCPTCRQCSFGKNQLVLVCVEVETTVRPSEVTSLPMDGQGFVENCRESC